jgi:hypothetical protein
MLGRCKSSINFGLQAIGYETIPMTPVYALAITAELPFFIGRSNEIRQWTMRVRTSQHCTGDNINSLRADLKTKVDSNACFRETPPDGIADLDPDEFAFRSEIEDSLDFSIADPRFLV